MGVPGRAAEAANGFEMTSTARFGYATPRTSTTIVTSSSTPGATTSAGSSVHGRLEKMPRRDIKRYSLEELKALQARGKTRTRADAPFSEIEEGFWEHAQVVMPAPGKTSVHLRVDRDVLEWFRKQGKGHLSRMNAVLRSYVEARRKELTHSSRRDR